jgi:hypothetical protein
MPESVGDGREQRVENLRGAWGEFYITHPLLPVIIREGG